MGRRFFIAHSSQDKDIAVPLAEILGEEAWVDLHEIDVGDLLLEEVSSGIENASDFVLLWSARSAESSWVRFELHMAFIRWLEDRAISIRVIRLDETTVPLYLKPFLQARDVTDPDSIASILRSEGMRRARLRPFVNRSSEIGRIEACLYSSEEGMFWSWGMPGIGKKALADAAARRIVADASVIKRIRVRSGTGFVELALMLRAVNGDPPMEERSIKEARDDFVHTLKESTVSGTLWIFEEAQHWLDDDAAPMPILEAVFEGLQKGLVNEAGHVAIFTSTRRPNLPKHVLGETRLSRLEGLKEDFGIALMKGRGSLESDNVLREAARHLFGHPLSMELVAREGLANRDWEEQRIRVATDLVALTPIHDISRELLEVLAILDGPLPGALLAVALDISEEEYRTAVAEANSYSLVEEGSSGYLQLHPLVNEFFAKGFRRRSDVRTHLSILADLSAGYLKTLTPGGPLWTESLMMSFRLMVTAGRIEDALRLRRDLHGVMYESAVHLYQERQYDEAYRYFDQVIAADPSDLEAKLFLARCLAHLERVDEARQLLDELAQDDPHNHRVLRVFGRVEYIARSWQRAVYYYQKALHESPTYRPLLVDIAQAKIRLEDWEGARVVLKQALDLGNVTPWGLNLYSQVLEHDGQLEDARRFIEIAIQNEPTNAGFFHRLGRIAQELGNRKDALLAFRQALRLDPNYPEAVLSMASILADIGDTSLATEYLDDARRLNPRQSLIANIEAKIALVEGRINQAQASIKRALELDRGAENIGMAAATALAAIELGVVDCGLGGEVVLGYCIELRELGDLRRADEYLTRLSSLCPGVG